MSKPAWENEKWNRFSSLVTAGKSISPPLVASLYDETEEKENHFEYGDDWRYFLLDGFSSKLEHRKHVEDAGPFLKSNSTPSSKSQRDHI